MWRLLLVAAGIPILSGCCCCPIPISINSGGSGSGGNSRPPEPAPYRTPSPEPDLRTLPAPVPRVPQFAPSPAPTPAPAVAWVPAGEALAARVQLYRGEGTRKTLFATVLNIETEHEEGGAIYPAVLLHRPNGTEKWVPLKEITSGGFWVRSDDPARPLEIQPAP